MFDIQIYGVKFYKQRHFGDFLSMSKQPQYSDSLFIFNDNEECHETSKRGLGNAVMRSFNKYSTLTIPKSAGIPTGTLTNGGYNCFSEHVKKIIDDSIREIIELIHKYKYKRLFYSSDSDGFIGTCIFNVSKKVIAYITLNIHRLSNSHTHIIKHVDIDFVNKYDFDKFHNNSLEEIEELNKIKELEELEELEDIDCF